MTGLNWCTCGAGQVGSTELFSATPAMAPRELMLLAAPLLPPSVGSGFITPYCHRKGTQELPEVGRPSALKPQKSSLSGSAFLVSVSPIASPVALAPKATLFFPPSPGWLMSIFNPLYQRSACCVLSEFAPAPLAKPFWVTEKAWPGGPPTTPMSVIV